MAERVPALLECGHSVTINASELDWNSKYWCTICGHDSPLDLRRRPIRKVQGARKSNSAAFLPFSGRLS